MAQAPRSPPRRPRRVLLHLESQNRATIILLGLYGRLASLLCGVSVRGGGKVSEIQVRQLTSTDHPNYWMLQESSVIFRSPPKGTLRKGNYYAVSRTRRERVDEHEVAISSYNLTG